MAITKNEQPKDANGPAHWDFQCEVPRCGFVSYGHSTKTKAKARGDEHMAEHESATDKDGNPQTATAMREIADWNAEHGV